MKRQISNPDKTYDNPAGQRNEHFSKFLHPLWDLGLVRDHLKSVDDILVLLSMLRYADFDTGECAVFIPRIMREAGIKHATQVKRCMTRIEGMGAFWRPAGKKGFKNVYGKSVRRYFRATGNKVITHALENDLIGEETLKQIEIRQVEKEIEAEARNSIEAGGAGGSVQQPRSTSGLDDAPETIDEVIEQMREDKNE